MPAPSTIQELSRANQVLLHHLRLGYHMRKELHDDFEGQHCGHCSHVVINPLEDYLLMA